MILCIGHMNMFQKILDSIKLGAIHCIRRTYLKLLLLTKDYYYY